MTEYEVLITGTAEADLKGIVRYITETLKDDTAARRVYSAIKKQVLSLSSLPLRYPLVRDEIFVVDGLRMMPSGNYLVFYSVDERTEKVHILRILYSRREWQNLLGES